MKGQWLGTFSGTNEGRIILNVDQTANGYEGIAYLIPSDSSLPFFAASFVKPDNLEAIDVSAEIILLDPRNQAFTSWDQIKHLYAADVTAPKRAQISGKWTIEQISLTWTTDVGTAGSAALACSLADKHSELASEKMTWDEYKRSIERLEESNYLFRGQQKRWRLRTSFHRSGRADLERYVNEDIPLLQKQLSSTTKHVFNLDIPQENGSFYSLLQHHGYPTPLLDWTESPYAAAFFAFRLVPRKIQESDSDEHVRIITFDRASWRSDFKQFQSLVPSILHLSLGEFLAIENVRASPQQAVSTVTNIDDIESYVKHLEQINRKTYLRAVDIPWDCRGQVMRELRYMGVTAASMFPGIDGICEAAREYRFAR